MTHAAQHLETWIQTQAQVTNASGLNCLYLALISKLTEELTQPLGRAWGKAEVSRAELRREKNLLVPQEMNAEMSIAGIYQSWKRDSSSFSINRGADK